MPQNSAHHRYRAEADFALSRLRVAREAGDQARCEEWHRAWSLSTLAADAELTGSGAGAKLLRGRTPPPLRPLPVDLPPRIAPRPRSGDLPPVHEEPAESTDLRPPPDELSRALERHARVETALLAGGPNPFPEEMDEGEWQFQLTAYRAGGPLDCELLQDAEAAVEALVEMLPEYWGDDPEDPEKRSVSLEVLQNAVLPECVRIYRESLADLTEGELRADLETCELAGRADTVALIETELCRRERETGPESDQPAAENRIQEGGTARSSGGTDSRPGAKSTGANPTAYGSSSERRARSGLRELAPSGDSARSCEAVRGYFTAPAWIDTAGRTRTWSLFDPAGEKMAEITTRRGAEKLAGLFNQLASREVVESALPADTSRRAG